MRAESVESTSQIAVVAKDPEPFRETISDEPPIQTNLAVHFPPVLQSAAVYVVYCQELVEINAAASAVWFVFTGIMLKYSQAGIPCPLLAPN
jgi:hypothetical protein